MALTRGEKKVSMPISAEAARLGTQQNKSNIFGALTQLVDPLIDLELQKQELEDKQNELSVTEAITNAKYHLDLDRYNRKTIRALDDAKKKEAKRIAEAKRKELEKIEDANNKNYVNSMKALIQLDINRAVNNFKIQHAGKPDQFASAINEWATGYTSRPEFPKQLVDRDGVVIGDFLLDFSTKLDGAWGSHYTTMKIEARNNHAETSWNTYVDSFNVTLTDKLEQINQIGDHIDFSVPELPNVGGDVRVEQQEIDLRYAAINENWLTKMDMIMNPLIKEYEGFVYSLSTLANAYPDKYNQFNVLEQVREKKTTLDSHILGAFSKFIITGNPETRDAEKATAVDFIEQWWRGDFNENSKGIGKYIHMWTSWTDHAPEEKDKIKKWALQEVNAKYDKSKLGFSKLVDGQNQVSKETQKRWEGDGLGSFKDMTSSFIFPSEDEIKSVYTTIQADGTGKTDTIAVDKALNEIQITKNLKEDFNLLRTGELEWHEVVSKNTVFGNKDTIIDAFYVNTIDGYIDGADIINRVNSSIIDGRPISTDTVLVGFQMAFDKTQAYPSSFVDVINTMTKIDPDNIDSVQQFQSALEIVNQMGWGGLDGNTYDAFLNANEVLKTGNVTKAVETFNRYFVKNQMEEKDIEKLVMDYDDMWLNDRISRITDHVTDQHATIFTVEALKKILLPKNMENFKYQLDDEQLLGTVPKQWFDLAPTEIEEALNSNIDVLNMLIRNEAKTLLMGRDIDLTNDQIGTEQLFEAASFNVFKRLNEGGWTFEWHMFDDQFFNKGGMLLTNVGIGKHTGWSSDTLASNSIIEVMAMTNNMEFQEAEDFWGTSDYQSKLMNLNEMWENGQIKFKFDERSRNTQFPQWHIMVDVSGEGEWKSLRNPEDYDYSWSPTGSLLTNANQASVESVKRSVINKMNMESLSSLYQVRDDGPAGSGDKSLWRYVGKGERGHPAHPDAVDGWLKIESGVIAENDKAMINAKNTFIALMGNNLELIKDVFQDWPDIDTWVEQATENQLDVANQIRIKKDEVENPKPLEALTKWKSMAQAFDVPNNNRIGDEFFIYDQNYVNELKNMQSYKAIGPALRLDDQGIAMLKSLHTGKEAYSDDDIEKILNGEMGIPVGDYDKLLDIKYEEAEEVYNDLYDDVIITPLQREILVDMIANVGLEFVGMESRIYKYIKEGNHFGVFNEIKRLQPFYVNKSRHAYHVNMWGTKSRGTYNF